MGPISLTNENVEIPPESGPHPAQGWHANDAAEVLTVDEDGILLSMDPSMKVGAPLIWIPRNMFWIVEMA